jgi:aerobic-type carbon monoxide dehydrogenase small subunit (CoxS/CutS family)
VAERNRRRLIVTENRVMRKTIEINLNGAPRQVQADPDAALMYLLRNDLDCKGTRFGCGTGNCGACTVILEGHAVQSCTTPLWSVENRAVTTVENLAQDAVGALVRDAFLQEQAAQCGYCINGIMMSVTALLQRTSHPGQDEIIEALNRHLCRCGTHVRILRAVQRAIRTIAEEKGK